MKCPYCDFAGTKVLDSRSANENKSIRRRRECEQCFRRFTTFEMIEETPLMVIKKDGSREEFSRDKLMRGLIRACEKRPAGGNDGDFERARARRGVLGVRAIHAAD